MNGLMLLRSHFFNAVPVSQSRYHCYAFLKFSPNQTYRFFYYWMFDLQFQLLILVFRVKTNSHEIHVSLILFSVYLCHRNINFPKNHILPNFDLRPVTGVNFTSIRVW